MTEKPDPIISMIKEADKLAQIKLSDFQGIHTVVSSDIKSLRDHVRAGKIQRAKLKKWA